MLSKMIVTVQKGEILVPSINDAVEELNELISYYKFLLKQRTQNKNHLGAIIIKNSSSIIVTNIKQELKSLNLKIDKIIAKMKDVLKTDKDSY